MDKYLKIILEYSLEGRLADKDFLEKVVNIAVENGIIQKTVNEVQLINDRYYSEIASFSPFYKTIYCYSNGICESVKEKFKLEHKNVSQIEYAFYYNFTFLHNILHEIEHAHQEELFLSLDQNIEETIIKMFPDRFDVSNVTVINILKNIKKYSLYKKYYIYHPIERLAELKASYQIHDILELAYAYEEIELEILKNIHNKNLINLFQNMSRGYTQKKDEIYVGPLYTYLEKTKDKNKLKQLDIYDDDIITFYQNSQTNYTIGERILYSLPISNEEDKFLHRQGCTIDFNRIKRKKSDSFKKIKY